MEKTLKLILTDNEIKVYTALLELGESLASKIGEKIGMNRTHVYDILESLINKGLVSYVIKNNRKFFRAANPNKLYDYLKEKEKRIKEQEVKIKEIIPNLLALQKPKEEKTITEIYHGKEGIKTIYNDILRKVKEYYVLGATGKIAEMLKYYFPQHERQRVKKKVKLKLLFNKSLRKKEIATKRKFAEIRFLPKEFSSPIPTTIYENRIVILIWTEPLAIVIENKEVTNTYKKYFDLLWNISRK